MAHFFGGVSGQAGEATRLGSKRSGIGAYVQNTGVRLTVDLHHVESSGKDIATLGMTGGWSTYYRSRTVRMNDAATILAALDAGDERMARIWKRIEGEFAKLDAEAPKALKRAERKRKAREREIERERIAERARLHAMADTITDTEREHYCSLLGYDMSDRADMGIEDFEGMNWHILRRGDVYRTPKGDLILEIERNRFEDPIRTYNLTTGDEIAQEVTA